MNPKTPANFLPAALVRGCIDTKTWRCRLDKIGLASIEFQSTEELIIAITSHRQFSFVLMHLKDVIEMKLDLQLPGLRIILIVDSEDWSHSEIRRNIGSMSESISFIDSSSSELESEFRVVQVINSFAHPQLINKSPKNWPLGDFSYKSYEISIAQGRILDGGREITLKSREYELAVLLFLNIGCILERVWLLERIWGQSNIDSRALDVCISRIRDKLNLKIQNLAIRSVYKKGYQLMENQVIEGGIESSGILLQNLISSEWTAKIKHRQI